MSEFKQEQNIFLASRSRIMKEKWQNVGSKLLKTLAVQKTKLNLARLAAAKEGGVNKAEDSDEGNKAAMPVTQAAPNPFRLKPGEPLFQKEANSKIGAGEGANRRKGSTVPSFSEERAKRHSTTYKLQKLVSTLMSNKSTHELMQLENIRKQMDNAKPQGAGTNSTENNLPSINGTPSTTEVSS